MLKNTSSKVSLQQAITQVDVEEEQDGFVTIYEQEVLFKIQLSDQEYPNQEALTVRISVQGGDQTLQSMKIELSCEGDLFFHFVHFVNEEAYQSIKEEQQITAQFIDYPAICVKSIDKAHKDPNQYSPVLLLMQNGDARVEVIQHTEYKNVELIAFEFHSLEEEDIRLAICKKYQLLKSKLQLMEGKLRDMNDVVKVKNPQLLLQMQRMRK